MFLQHSVPPSARFGHSTPRQNHRIRPIRLSAALLSGLTCCLGFAVFPVGIPAAHGQAPVQAPGQAPAQQPVEPATQAPAQAPQTTTPAPATEPATIAPPPATAPASSKEETEHGGEITENEVKQLLLGKPLFLRGSYLGDSISFNEHGVPAGHPTPGPYTLSGIEITKVHLTKHRVELEGNRYALHFLGALPYEDTTNAVERIRITPKKKVLKISIDREEVIKPKKVSEKKSKDKKPAGGVQTTPAASPAPASEETDTAAPATAPAPSPAPDQAAELPAVDQASVTTTTSPAHAAKVLRDALDRIFAPALDDKLKAQMPDFWQLYYHAQAAGIDYRPADASILRSSAVDQQAKLTSSVAPESNEYAQASGIAGPALYRVVVGSDGRPGEIAVERPIGFGLDENAVSAIRKASFQPALKDGKPVAETLDLAVMFRIYSKRTSVAANEVKTADPIKPGPYTVHAQQQQQQPAPPQPQPQPTAQPQP
jgi:TonB family protein